MSRPAALAASALVLSLALGACAPQADAPPTPSASGAPITVVHGGEGLEAAVAAVLARHLRHDQSRTTLTSQRRPKPGAHDPIPQQGEG